MSDFISGFWSTYIAVISVVSILACLVVLWIAGRHRVKTKPGGVVDNTTGHVWDEDLQELNNPLPRWWMWLFILTVVFALGYLYVFPGLGSYRGNANWSSANEHAADIKQLQAQSAAIYGEFANKTADALIKDSKAIALGERLFLNNCAQCHGSDGRGSKGFPDLTQSASAWLGEKTHEQIKLNIANGRTGVMPALAAAVGSEEDARDVANYVLSLSGAIHDARRVEAGKAKFGICAGCHGADGKGNKALGASNLTDSYWLHGRGEAAIMAMIKNGKSSVMPAHASKLSEAQIHVLAAYVLSLSANQVEPTAK